MSTAFESDAGRGLSAKATKAAERAVRAAAAARFGRGNARIHYGDGGWWAIVTDEDGDDSVYTVQDLDHGFGPAGLCFEEV